MPIDRMPERHVGEAQEIEPSGNGPIGAEQQPLTFGGKPPAEQRGRQFARAEQRHEGTTAEIEPSHHFQHIFGHRLNRRLIEGRH